MASAAAKVAQAFRGTELTFKGIEIPALNDLEKQLKDEFDSKKGTLTQSWEEFRKQKLDEFAVQGPLGGDPEGKGEDDRKRYGAGMSKGLAGTEAVLFNSAEALSRRLEYIERLREGRQANGASSGGTPGGVTGATLNVRQQERQNGPAERHPGRHQRHRQQEHGADGGGQPVRPAVPKPTKPRRRRAARHLTVTAPPAPEPAPSSEVLFRHKVEQASPEERAALFAPAKRRWDT